jgi:hypothetical protein
MANVNFIVQNGINIGGSSGANISVDPTTGAIVFAPAPTASVPNPTAVVFTTAGTVQTVATTGGVVSGSAVATANAASATTLTNGTANVTVNTANITMGVGGTQVWTVTSSGVTGAGTAQFNSLNVTGTATAATINAGTIGNSGATLTGTLSTASQPNITTLAGVTSIGTSGVTTTAAGNFTITGCLTVNGTTTTINNTIQETTEYVSTIDATTLRAVTIGNSGAVLYGTINSSSASQTNITAVGTLTGLTVSGAIVPNANASINIGSTSAWWNNIYGTSTHALYADLAENYQADRFYNPGTVLMFGGVQEVTIADADTTRVAGVVSTNPAHLMNGALSGPNVIAVAFTGRVPCQVIGPVAKGDLMVSAGFGYAKVNNTPQVGTVIGKALQDFQIAGKGVIEVVVGRF